jgi:hypothetical protein
LPDEKRKATIAGLSGAQQARDAGRFLRDFYCRWRAARANWHIPRGENAPAELRGARSMSTLVLLLGLAVGVAVGLMGSGGGILLVPALAYLIHFGQHLSQGTSLFVQLPPIGIGALQTYWKNGHVELRAGLACAAGIFVGAYFGSFAALKIPPRELEAIYGVFLMGAAMLLFHQAQREPRRPRRGTPLPAAAPPAPPRSGEQR